MHYASDSCYDIKSFYDVSVQNIDIMKKFAFEEGPAISLIEMSGTLTIVHI